MPVSCAYCGLVLRNQQDMDSHPVPCRPGVAPGSLTVGVAPGETTAPDPLAGDAALPPDDASQGLKTTGA